MIAYEDNDNTNTLNKQMSIKQGTRKRRKRGRDGLSLTRTLTIPGKTSLTLLTAALALGREGGRDREKNANLISVTENYKSILREKL